MSTSECQNAYVALAQHLVDLYKNFGSLHHVCISEAQLTVGLVEKLAEWYRYISPPPFFVDQRSFKVRDHFCSRGPGLRLLP